MKFKNKSKEEIRSAIERDFTLFASGYEACLKNIERIIKKESCPIVALDKITLNMFQKREELEEGKELIKDIAEDLSEILVLLKK